jgi:hypothetical protein
MTAWLEVPAQTEISRFSANSPELAAIRHAFCLCTLPIELRGPFRGRFKNLRQPPDELVEQLKEAMGRLSAGLEI